MSNEASDKKGILTQEEKQRLVDFYEILMRIERRERVKQCHIKEGSGATS